MGNDFPYYMPAEWETHKGTIVAWPSNKQTWQGVYSEVENSMASMVAVISRYEEVYLSLKPTDNKNQIMEMILNKNANEANILLLDIINNDSWTRDYGPNYLFSKDKKHLEIAVNNWGYNAWGEKYPPWKEDAKFARRFAQWMGCKSIFDHDMILEGGSIDVNGNGVLLTTSNCLLNINRNPHLRRDDIENNLRKYLGVEDIIWLKDGIVGDDTDGHIDDFARFISPEKIICCSESNKSDDNYEILNDAYSLFLNSSIIKKHDIEVVLIPMPSPKFYENIRLPLSYANFYFINGAILVPIFDDPLDDAVLEMFAKQLPSIEVIGIKGLPFLRGLGGIHCLTQQVY